MKTAYNWELRNNKFKNNLNKPIKFEYGHI